jgi:hypothetical protein
MNLEHRAVVVSILAVVAVARPDAAHAWFPYAPACSQPVTIGAGPVVVDCLYILQASLGLRYCDAPCVCRPTGGDTTTAGDALRCLSKAVGVDGELACGCFDTDVVDFSRADRVSFRRLSALGFCAPFGEVFKGEVVRASESELVARLTVLADGEILVDECRFDLEIDPGPDTDCPVLVELPERVLISEERDEWLAAIGAVSVENLPDPYCETVAYDPCVIAHFDFDGTKLADWDCASPRLPIGEAARLVAALNALAH